MIKVNNDGGDLIYSFVSDMLHGIKTYEIIFLWKIRKDCLRWVSQGDWLLVQMRILLEEFLFFMDTNDSTVYVAENFNS